ncbi:MAG: hypothetical protein HKP37_05235 [Boseongicola sp.]|nr:hypothetical protein [Boseongicola sp.]
MSLKPPCFTLTVATSRDGFIARAIDDTPQNWASAEEQELFFRDVEAADWAIMGKNTHLAADKPHRHRIIFSTKTKGWQRPTQLWCDPSELGPSDLVSEVAGKKPLQNGLILGGTRVHDWFFQRRAIHKVNLTVEPLTFVNGLPIFSDQGSSNPLGEFINRGFKLRSEKVLNTLGTRYYELFHASNP